MTLDNETSLLYLSEHIRKHGRFFSGLSALLLSQKIAHRFLPNTRDIWAVDYMPVQVGVGNFVQFKYKPDYLQCPKYINTQTDTDEVCMAIGLNRTHSDIVLDGGNVIKGKNWVILTDKVFKENPLFPQKKLIAELEGVFAARVIIIPREPYDYTGHADGMVRYYDEETLLINRYGDHISSSYKSRLMKVLRGHDFKLIEIPYAPDRSDRNSANGLYINYLEMQSLILIPIFRKHDDEKAVRTFEELFRGSNVCVIDATELSIDGGVLHCISWPIAIK
jgi:agmatine deiminase